MPKGFRFSMNMSIVQHPYLENNYPRKSLLGESEWVIYIFIRMSSITPFPGKLPGIISNAKCWPFFDYFATNLRFCDLFKSLRSVVVHQNWQILGMLKYWKSTGKHYFLVWSVHLVLGASIVCGDKTRGVITKFLTRPVTLQPTSSTYNGHYESTWARVNLNWAAHTTARTFTGCFSPFSLFLPISVPKWKI